MDIHDKIAALDIAVKLHEGRCSLADEVVNTAELFYAFLIKDDTKITSEYAGSGIISREAVEGLAE